MSRETVAARSRCACLSNHSASTGGTERGVKSALVRYVRRCLSVRKMRAIQDDEGRLAMDVVVDDVFVVGGVVAEGIEVRRVRGLAR